MKNQLTLCVLCCGLFACDTAPKDTREPVVSTTTSSTTSSTTSTTTTTGTTSGTTQTMGEAALELVTWNVESGDSDPAVVADYFEEFNHIQLWGLTEVDYDAAFLFRSTISEGPGDYLFIAGTSGDYAEHDDRLVILYDTLRFESLDTCELSVVTADNPNNQRVPLVAHMRDLNDGTEFLFMVNHLQRDEGVRQDQADRLTEWVNGTLSQPGCNLSSATLPLLAVGDYNLDVDVRYDYSDNTWLNSLLDALTWVKPDPFVQSHCSWDEMLLDFIFVAGAATSWSGTAEVYTVESDAVCGWPTDDSADHRPVFAKFWY